MARIDIKQLEAFVQVADLASFRGAAAVLKTTQPNISARIARLEEQLDQSLMERDAGSVRLTQAGVKLVDKARVVLNSLDDFMATADATGLFDGTLRLGVTELIVYSWLGAYLNELRARFPNVQVDLTVDLSSNLTTALFNQSIDLALQSGPFSQQTTGEISLGRYAMVWVASPTLGVAKRISTPKALTKQPILTHARETLPFKQLEQHFSNAAHVYLVPSTSLSACMQMTLEGIGVACLPRAMVAEEIAQGRLVQIRYQWVPDDLSFDARFHLDKAPYHLQQAAELAKEVASSYTPK